MRNIIHHFFFTSFLLLSFYNFSGVVWDCIYSTFESRYRYIVSLPCACSCVCNLVQECAQKVGFENDLDVRIGPFGGFEACHLEWDGHCLIVLSHDVHTILSQYSVTDFCSDDVVVCRHIVCHEIGHIYHKHLCLFLGLFKKVCCAFPDIIFERLLTKDFFVRKVCESIFEVGAFCACGIPAYILMGLQEKEADAFALGCIDSERELRALKVFFERCDTGYWREWFERVTLQNNHPTCYDRAQAVEKRIDQLRISVT